MSRIGFARLVATSLLLQCLLALNGLCGRLAMVQSTMTHGYYDSTSCSNVEARARQYYNLESVMHPTLSGALLRLVFHDCAVGVRNQVQTPYSFSLNSTSTLSFCSLLGFWHKQVWVEYSCAHWNNLYKFA